jgi:DNA-directed RNA polymerase specialized sigma24 family protein
MSAPTCGSMSQAVMTRFDSTSWSLVLGAAAAIPKDQEEFGRRYGPLVRSYFAARWRLSTQHERIADASQEVFLRLFSPCGPLTRVDQQRPSGFRPFLRGVLQNVAAELERRARRDRTAPLDHETIPIDHSEQSPADAFDRV